MQILLCSQQAVIPPILQLHSLAPAQKLVLCLGADAAHSGAAEVRGGQMSAYVGAKMVFG